MAAILLPMSIGASRDDLRKLSQSMILWMEQCILLAELDGLGFTVSFPAVLYDVKNEVDLVEPTLPAP